MEETEPPSLSKPPVCRTASRDKPPPRDKPAPGSLDRRRHHHHTRMERDQKSRSSYILKSPPRLDDFTCQNRCICMYDFCFDHYQRRHDQTDPQRYGSNPVLEQHQHQGFMDRGSHPDIYNNYGRYRHDYQCCSYQMGPLPCCFTGDRNYHYFQAPYFKVPTILFS